MTERDEDRAARDHLLWCLGNASARLNMALVDLREARTHVLCADPAQLDGVDVAMLEIVGVRDRMLMLAEEKLDEVKAQLTRAASAPLEAEDDES